MKVLMTRRLAFLLALAPALLNPRWIDAADGGTDGIEKIARPFFAQHCSKCHGEKKKKGDLRVDTLPMDFNSPKIMGNWEEIMNRVNSGDMPPEDEDRPKPEDIARIAEW